MTNPVWPYSLRPQGLEWRLKKAGLQMRSPFSGSVQAIDFVGDYWLINVSFRGEGRIRARSQELEALLMYMAGGVHQLDIFNWARPFPRGTLRGAPTLQVVTLEGDSSLVLTVAPGATLEAGDLIGMENQIFMARTPCIASGTTLTVPLVNKVRKVIPETTAVVWNRPTIPVVMPETSAGVVYRPGLTLPSEAQFEEAFVP